MINEDNLKKFVEDKCYDLLSAKRCYESAYKTFQYGVNNYTIGVNSTDSLTNWLENLKRWESRYIKEEYILSQFCHQLGDDYVEIWNRIVERES